MTALEFMARWADHVPDRHEVGVRYARAYATRRRVWWRRRGVELGALPPVVAPPGDPAGEWPALRARKRRWAELLRRVFQVEVEVCFRCGGEVRMLAFVTEPTAVRKILAHLERRGVEARAGPWADAALPAGGGGAAARPRGGEAAGVPGAARRDFRWSAEFGRA